MAIARRIEPLEEVIDDLKEQLRARHIYRLQQGHCSIAAGFVWSDILTNLERTADHCSNIAVYTMQLPSDMLDAHKYLNSIKSSSNSNFVEDYEMYKSRYALRK